MREEKVGIYTDFGEKSMQLKIIKIDPPGFTKGLFDLQIGSGVFV